MAAETAVFAVRSAKPCFSWASCFIILQNVSCIVCVCVCVCVCVSVCLSVTRRYCIETASRMELFFLHKRFPRPMQAVLEKLRYLQKGTSFWNFVLNSGLRKFRLCIPTVGECDINSNSGRSGVDSTWRRRQFTRQVQSIVNDRLPSVDCCATLYIDRLGVRGIIAQVPST